jgi:hypothetical protein
MGNPSGTYRLPGDRYLDLNAWQMSPQSDEAYIFAEPPYGSMLIGCESMSMTFRVARGIAPPNMLAPSVEVYRKIIPRSRPGDGRALSPDFTDRVYAFWAKLMGTALGVDNYYFHVDGLVQDTGYYLVINAAASEVHDPINNPLIGRAFQSWAFRTSRREVTVDTTSLEVYRDGDSAGSGEMYFEYGVYDGESGTLFGRGRYPNEGYATIADGTVIANPFGPFFKRNISNSMMMQIYGEDDDTSPFPFGGLYEGGHNIQEYPTDNPDYWNDGREEEIEVHAQAGAKWRFLQLPGIYEQPFSLYSGNWGVSFSVKGRIRVEIIPASQGPLLLDAGHNWVSIPKPTLSASGTTLSRNERLKLRAQRDYRLHTELQKANVDGSSQSGGDAAKRDPDDSSEST